MQAILQWFFDLVSSGAILFFLVYLSIPVCHFFRATNHKRHLRARIAAGKLNPRGFEVRFALGEIYLKSRRWAKAEQELSRAVNLFPEHANCHSQYGLALFHLGKFREATEQFETALQIRPEEGYGQTHLMNARCYHALKEFPAAIDWYQRTMARNSSLCEPSYCLGQLYREQGLKEESGKAFRQTIQTFSRLDRNNYWRNLRFYLLARFYLACV